MKAIIVNNVTKEYQLYKHPRDAFFELILKKKRHIVKKALDNVSFSVEKGETFGVLGGNGSGKSTILSIINGTTFPTFGKVVTNGTVSLLNVSAGIIGGYTGKQNIYYKCGIMGLSKAQVDEMYDSIADFSEIEEYLDQPVKKYSSGMKAKLGFSISIHIKPDILIVDEALSVGDAMFQMKCNKKIAELRKEGITILLVSHSPGAVQKICSRSIWIQDGVIIGEAKSDLICPIYSRYMAKKITIDQAKELLKVTDE